MPRRSSFSATAYPGRAYLEFAFGLAADADRPAEWASLAEAARARFDALPATPRDEADALWLDRQRVRALRADGRDAEAVALVEAAYPAGHPFRRETFILRLLADGRPGDAVHLAERWSRDEPRAPEPLRLLARACREVGSFGEMDAALGRLRALDPVKPEPLLYALAQNRLAGRDEAARAALDEIILRHGAGAAVYSAAAAVLVEAGDAAGIDRLEAELRDRGLPLRSVLQARLQLAVSRRDWPAVLRRVADLRAAGGPAPADARTAWLETAARLARACLDGGSGTQTSLVEIVSDHPGTLRLYTLILGSLLDAGRAATARQILTLAEGPYQNARAIVALRARVETALAAAEPPPAAPVEAGAAPDRLASFDVFSGVFASCIEKRDTDSALELLAAVRRARPG